MGGAEISWDRLIEESRDWRFGMLQGPGGWSARLESRGVRCHDLDLGRVAVVRKTDPSSLLAACADVTSLPMRLRRVLRFLEKMEHDIVFTSCNKGHVLAGLLGTRLRRPVVCTVHDLLTTDHFNPALLCLLRLMFRRADAHLLCFSDAVARSLTALGLASTRIHRVHHGVDISAIEAAAHAIPAPIIPGQGPVVAMFGRISYWKGQTVFLDAVGSLLARGIKLRPVLVGDAVFQEDAYLDDFRRRLATLPEPGAHWAGWQDHPLAWMNGADIVVHASTRPEPFGLVAIEAMALGKPVIATRGGGIPEIVVDGETGLLVPMADAPALARAIERLMGDHRQQTSMGDRGRERVREFFSLSRFRNEITIWLDSLARAGV